MNDLFMFGDNVLVAPMIEFHTTTKVMWLPKENWKYLGETSYAGGQAVAGLHR